MKCEQNPWNHHTAPRDICSFLASIATVDVREAIYRWVQITYRLHHFPCTLYCFVAETWASCNPCNSYISPHSHVSVWCTHQIKREVSYSSVRLVYLIQEILLLWYLLMDTTQAKKNKTTPTSLTKIKHVRWMVAWGTRFVLTVVILEAQSSEI